jgi:hypothetical protein
MTEDEAKTKTCCASLSPIAFAKMDVGSVSQSIELRNCIGSACMAWRWQWVRPESGVGVDVQSDKHGNCGLAGKP